MFNNTILLQKYKVIKKINQGSFGEIYLGRNLKNKDEVAIKFEKEEQV